MNPGVVLGMLVGLSALGDEAPMFVRGPAPRPAKTAKQRKAREKSRAARKARRDHRR